MDCHQEPHLLTWIDLNPSMVNKTLNLLVTGLCEGNSRVIHRWPVNSPHKGPVTWKIFPFDDVVMCSICSAYLEGQQHAWSNWLLQATPNNLDLATPFMWPHIKAEWCIYVSDVYMCQHDDVIKWKHSLPYWPFVRGLHWSPVNFPHRGQ